ncbi:MAG: pantetheine-phosphate adenylyltransferase [Chloroflexota bacterium]|nr:pantetheine-phosphate adenylyltransferase [Chloroflexota bacterium]
MTKALYPDTFDPITYGHLDIVHRAAQLFDELIVAVEASSPKKALLDLEARVRLVRETLDEPENVHVAAYEGLAVEFARRIEADAIVHVLRIASDLEHEMQLALMGRRLAPEIDHICLMSAPDYTYVTSKIVKEVALLGGDVTPFVPPLVEAALEAHRPV